MSLWLVNRRRREALALQRKVGLVTTPASPPACLVDYRTLKQVRDRLVVLYDKADRLQRFRDSGWTDSSMLDEKQLAILAETVNPAARFSRIFRTLRWTIDYLESRRRTLERREEKRLRRQTRRVAA